MRRNAPTRGSGCDGLGQISAFRTGMNEEKYIRYVTRSARCESHQMVMPGRFGRKGGGDGGKPGWSVVSTGSSSSSDRFLLKQASVIAAGS